jgi:imidazolonepropionase-like amidohydrolase
VSSIVIKPGRLIDGSGQPALDGMLVVIEGNQISRVGKVTDGVPEAQTVIEAPQATLMPGMVDAHVHLAYDGSPKLGVFRLEATSMSYPLLALRAVQHGVATLRAGFTAVRDLNAPGGVILALRDAVNAGYLAGPRVKACGQGLSVTSGHMDKGGWADHISLRDMNFPCNGADSFRYGVREQVKRGADCIKINLCGGSSKDLKQPFKQEMTDDEVIAAIDEAHRLERHVAAHTSGGPSVTMAVRAGLDSVEHGHWIDEETADLMAEKGCTYVPTLLVNERNFDFTPEQMGVSLGGWTWLERAREDKWASLERVHRAGAKIAVGTDAGFMVTHGEMNARELEYLVQGGLSPLEAITAATRHGAELLGIDAGVIAAGKLADLVLVEGQPDQDVRVLQDVSKLRVFKDGKEVTA